MTTATDKRLVARASASIQRRIATAAELSGSTLSQFLIDAALKEADRVTKEATQLQVSMASFETIMNAYDRPARAMPKLRRAAQKYRSLINENQEVPTEKVT
jgi:uncharacterized protein (DUF1778 family)